MKKWDGLGMVQNRRGKVLVCWGWCVGGCGLWGGGVWVVVGKKGAPRRWEDDSTNASGHKGRGRRAVGRMVTTTIWVSENGKQNQQGGYLHKRKSRVR